MRKASFGQWNLRLISWSQGRAAVLWIHFEFEFTNWLNQSIAGFILAILPVPRRRRSSSRTCYSITISRYSYVFQPLLVKRRMIPVLKCNFPHVWPIPSVTELELSSRPTILLGDKSQPSPSCGGQCLLWVFGGDPLPIKRGGGTWYGVVMQI